MGVTVNALYYPLGVLRLTQRSASQVANQGPVALAQRLTQSLRNAGDLEVATPQRLCVLIDLLWFRYRSFRQRGEDRRRWRSCHGNCYRS